MLLILVAHAIAALLAPVCIRVLGRNGFLPLALVPAASLVWVIANWGSDHTVRIEWVPGLSMNFDLRFDSLAGIMSLLVLGIGALVLVYCARYFTDDEPRLDVFAAELVAFAGAMFGLVISDNMLLLYIFWELTTVLSFLLVGHSSERATSRRAAVQALLVTTAGGLSMLVGIIVLGEVSDSYLLSDVIAAAPRGWLVDVAIVLILIGALSKSAIVPLHFWLPGAMAAPTPVSAYLHAAAMVKAGVYLIARLAPGFAGTAPWYPMVLALGLFSMLIAGWRALAVHDLKLLLAFGTVSQLGFVVLLVGIGTPNAALAGTAMMLAHALFKATLFMVVGIVEHATGTRDLRKLAHLWRRAPVLTAIATLAALSMAGLPPFMGFVAKEADFEVVATTEVIGKGWATALLVGIVLGSVLTFAYSARFLFDTFGNKGRSEPSPAVVGMHRPGWFELSAPGVLALAGVVCGLAAPAVDKLLRPYAETMGAADYHLALWHGFGLPLGLTVIVVVGGLLVYLQLDRITRWRRHMLLGNADRAYDATVTTMDRLSMSMTGFVQRGSLPLTQATIFTTFAVLPVLALAFGTRTGVDLRLWDSPLQLAIGAVIVAAALATTVMRNRLASVLLVGVTGYGCGVVFALHGAPDLALTQFLVETLTLVIFVLVLRKLPAEVEDERIAAFRLPRAMIAVAVGAAVTAVAAFAVNARSTAPIALQLPQAAYEIGNGKNVVNVLLVDIRAWDTLGEIAVLLVAATGVASVVFRHRRFGLAPRVADAPPEHVSASADEVTWLRGGDLIPSRHRLLVLEVTTRLIFPTIMVLSVYFFLSGHNAPGGGFAGGLTAGLALVLRYLA
ncbi:MAG: Na+/H+ antiporter subunit A, partial [Aldersonia sp.]|nr:Na+/H+ antiporter subunit A [Aldersonia sp.]